MINISRRQISAPVENDCIDVYLGPAGFCVKHDPGDDTFWVSVGGHENKKGIRGIPMGWIEDALHLVVNRKFKAEKATKRKRAAK